MGLDFVEIDLNLEEMFHISIDDEARGHLTTLGKIHEYIWQRLQGIEPAIPCRPSVLSERIRGAVLGLPGARRSLLWPTLESMIPRLDRNLSWERLGLKLGCPLPPLQEKSDSSSPGFPNEYGTPFDLAKWLLQHHPLRFPNEREERRKPIPEGAGRFDCWQSFID